MSIKDIKEESLREFDEKFPELLKKLDDPEDHTYKFLFQKQNREVKNFLFFSHDKLIDEIIKIMREEYTTCHRQETRDTLSDIISKLKVK